MKKAYIVPEAKVFEICAGERVAAACGGASFTYTGWGCTDLLTDGMGEEACNSGSGNFSS